MAVLYDTANELAWLGSRRIPMRDGNILLIDRVDNVGGPLDIRPLERGDLRIPSTIASCAKPLPMSVDSAIAATLLANAAIRAFVLK